MFRKLFLLLFFIMTVSICAQIPAYHDVTSKIKSGEIPAPYFLVNSSVIKDRGVDQGWRDENLFDKNNQPDVNRIFGPSRIPIGNWKALVILVQFSDQASSATASSFDGLIFDQSSGTVWDYYKQVSYGALDIVTVNLPSSIGWTSAPQPYSYYVNGQNGFGSYPQNVQKLVEDVVYAADPLVDFSQYDNDGDGNVDALFIVHTGPGAEFTGSSNDIWSHAWVTNNTPFLDGVNITHYSMEPEYWSTPGDMTAGVFCHELGHAAFGLPDVYDRDYSSNGLGDWSLMAGGSWNGTLGSSPAFPDAWNHIQMGYVVPTIVSADVVSQSINDVENYSEIYKLWTNGNPGNEYFLVENRQLTGFDATLPGGGLNIYHVDENVTTQNDNEWYPGNSSSGHYLVALEQSDGLWDLEQNINRGDAGDSYPGATVNNEFLSASLPNSNDYNSNDTYVGVTNISSSNPTMTADFQVGNSSSLHPTNLSGNVNQANGEVQLNWDYGTPSWDFYEDFEDGVADNWLMSDSRLAVDNGYLKMLGTNINTWASTYYDKIYSDFTFEAEVERTQSETTLSYSLGAFVRANGFFGTGTESGYLINITADGYYSAFRMDAGAFTILVDWTASPLINTGLNAANVVTINASGANFDVYINGNFAFSFTDATYSSGFNNLCTYDSDTDINEVWWNYASCSIGTLMPSKKDIIPFTASRNYNASPEKTNLPSLHNAYVSPKRLMELTPAVFDNFNIYRDGVAIGTSTTTNFTDNLLAHGTYSYEVTAVDSGVESEPSNLIDLIWAGSPIITFNPSSFSETLSQGETSNQILSINNTGDGDLLYNINVLNNGGPLSTKNKYIENLHKQKIKHLELRKGEKDLRKGQKVIRGAGGPDVFGYSWIDSDEPGGPAFDWFDISGIGTNTGLTGDDGYVELNLPFNLDFYGQTKTILYISTNGLIAFNTNSVSQYQNQAILDPTEPNDFIAPFWDDLISTASSANYYYYDPTNHRFIIQYSDWGHYDGTGPVNFQVQLYENGTIFYYYNTMGGTLNSATVGIENSDASDGLQVVFNNDYIHDNLAVRISQGPPWLMIGPYSGVVTPGTTENVDLNFDATMLNGGIYGATINIFHNAGNELNPVEIPVQLTVNAANLPNIVLNKTSLLSTVTSDTVVVDTFVISNTGLADLSYTIDDIETSSPSHLNIKSIEVIKMTQQNKGDSPNDYLKYISKKIKVFDKASVSWLTESPTSGVIPPGGNNEILVTFNSNGVASGIHNADIIISSNDPDEPTVTVNATLSRNQINLTTDDNEDNALSGNPDYDMDNYLSNDDLIAPIEFNIFINETTINSTQLNIYAWDIDETDGEVDEVYVNGHLIGSLTGANDEWSTTVLPVDPTFIVPGPNGKNLVQVFIDVNNEGWAVSVDWGQLIINGATSSNAFIRSVNLSGTAFNFGDNIGITNEIDTDIPSQNVTVETNILDPSNVNVGGTSRTVPISGTNDEPFTENLLIPASGTEGTYNVQVIVYDADTFIQQDIRLVPFEVSANTPSIEVSPTSFSFTVPEGGTDSGVLTISNNGFGDLNWNIDEQVAPLLNKGKPEIFSTRNQEKQWKNILLKSNFRKINVQRKSNSKYNDISKSNPRVVDVKMAPSSLNILTIDFGPVENTGALDLLGITYTKISPADFAAVNLNDYDILYVGWSVELNPTAMDVLYNRKTDIENFIDNGGGLVALASIAWNWLPWDIDFSLINADDVIITDTTHPVMENLTSTDLSSWSQSYHNIFTNIPSDLTTISTNSSGGVLTLVGAYGLGRVVITGQDPDYHFYFDGVNKAGILLNNMLNWVGGSGECNWISEAPTSGFLSGGSNQNVEIMVDASSLSIGTYNCNLLINSNDPANSQITIPVTLNVVSGGATDSVSVPDISSNCDSDIEVPIEVSSTDGQNIISFQFDLNYDPNSLTPFDASSVIDISGTIIPGSWTVLANTDTLGKVTVAGFSATPLSGSGTLLKLKFHTSTLEGTSNLTLTNFMFNNGTPSVNITNGLLDISCGLCGDADEDGSVYALDAAKTLQAAIGLITLTPQGEDNADVDMGGSVSAFDAALILRHVIGLPEPVTTCFEVPMMPEGLSKANGINLEILPLNLDKNKDKTVVEIGLGGITSADNIYSLEMEVELQHEGSLNISGIPSEYVSGINQIDGTHYKVAIIAAKGISTDKIKLRIEYPSAATGTITFNDVKLNDQQTADITSVNIGETLNIKEYKLVGSYPNPFNPSTKIVFEVPQKGIVKIEVYDILGRLVSTLINTEYNQGHYEVTWNGINNSGKILSSGTYIAVMKAGNYQHSIKMNLLK